MPRPTPARRYGPHGSRGYGQMSPTRHLDPELLRLSYKNVLKGQRLRSAETGMMGFKRSHAELEVAFDNFADRIECWRQASGTLHMGLIKAENPRVVAKISISPMSNHGSHGMVVLRHNQKLVGYVVPLSKDGSSRSVPVKIKDFMPRNLEAGSLPRSIAEVVKTPIQRISKTRIGCNGYIVILLHSYLDPNEPEVRSARRAAVIKTKLGGDMEVEVRFCKYFIVIHASALDFDMCTKKRPRGEPRWATLYF